MKLKDAIEILERDKRNLNVNKIVDIPKEKSIFKRNLLLGAYQAIFDNIKEAIEVIVEALERLKEDNYKLDRENQLLFESQFNSKHKIKEDREFVCVSQGIEIFRTMSQEEAINLVKEGNDEWFKYVQECVDNNENYADNYIELYIEED